MEGLGKTILFLGLGLAALGALLLLAPRIGLPLGRLPGDLHWRSRSGNTQVYFPLATCIVLSLLFSLLSWLLRR
ncbi:MAG: DUF2905 domain-containing protein [Acidobacteriota bacterium]|nr:DUF2905 domain-containing protein [Acidobacteriota bacterium]